MSKKIIFILLTSAFFTLITGCSTTHEGKEAVLQEYRKKYGADWDQWTRGQRESLHQRMQGND